MQANLQTALDQYRQVGVKGQIDEATPYRLIQMLMEGALEKIGHARHFMLNAEKTGDYRATGKKGENISMAMSIIDGLRVSLNKEAGGQIAENLDMLYEYMNHRLLEANTSNDSAILEEVTGLLKQIKEAWDGIGDTPEAKNHTFEK
jgi:flagellar protein FliS